MASGKLKKHFYWWTFFPALLLAVAGIVMLALPVEKALAFAITVGVIFTLSAIPLLFAFFLGKDENPARLLAGVSQLACALWLFIDSMSSIYVLCVAIAVIIALHQAAEILDAVRSRKEEGKWWIVRIVLAACFVGLAIVLPCDPFAQSAQLLRYAGIVVLIHGLIYAGVSLLLSLFEKEEELKFRPVKKTTKK